MCARSIIRFACITCVASLLVACFPPQETKLLPPFEGIQHIRSVMSGGTPIKLDEAATIQALVQEINTLRKTEWRKLNGGKASSCLLTIELFADDPVDMSSEPSDSDTTPSSASDTKPRIMLMMSAYDGVFNLQEAGADYRQLMVSGYAMRRSESLDAYPQLHALWKRNVQTNTLCNS